MHNEAKQKMGQACALALFQSYEMESGFLKKIHKEFSGFLKILVAFPPLKQHLENPIFLIKDKDVIVNEVFTPKYTKNFLNILLQKNFIGYLPQIIRSFDLLFKKHFRIENVYVRVETLDEDIRGKIEQFLKEYFKNCTVKTHFQKDRGIWGGFIMETDTLYWDHSLKGRLYSLTREVGK